ncbi:MPN499 family protein [Mycoplasmopsis cynos]|uniref:MPN499 family protein n=1 Tax=Mycoplasmopsis cynos TaxID=171284 RepID=UPI0021FB3AED|nr:hypothetical protein [Mycoplasmopsis cynos]UWV81924.1 hypothetical protein NW065_02280 [Mycoplasmopsis cynos]UWV92958.1 hypothetical protein NWE57_02950 [Mycoplasmopsis cynos]WAM10818.1 hypothetical protein ONA00_05905 [Mycoplasmopsis cynos]WQQ16488.1 hypothetical protein RRG51_01875 [Mycoplasmopsis cynos]WQQ17128.1 hypothetical protein RRG39_01120 [Mycoplasmopsis cynos]
MLNEIIKLKINQTLTGFWLVPSFLKILTPRSHEFVIKYAKSLKELIIKNNLLEKNIKFSFNKDTDFSIFNTLMKLKGYDFQLNVNHINKLLPNQYIDYEIVENIIIRFDKKTLQTIYNGNIFFYSKEYFKKNYQKYKNKDNEKIFLQWTWFDFKILK